MSAEFAGTLRERIVIEKQAAERTPMGVHTGGWEVVARCLAAIEPEGVGAEREAMALSAMPRFRITIRPRDGIAIDQRVTWRGRTLMVRQLIDDLQQRDRVVLRCEETRP